MKLLKSVQFKRKLSFAAVGGAVIGALYLMYYKGRTDEIKELVAIAEEHGQIALDFKLNDGVHGIIVAKG